PCTQFFEDTGNYVVLLLVFFASLAVGIYKSVQLALRRRFGAWNIQFFPDRFTFWGRMPFYQTSQIGIKIDDVEKVTELLPFCPTERKMNFFEDETLFVEIEGKQYDFASIPIPCQTVEEQEWIANFFREKCGLGQTEKQDY
ncbi:MAG: hypothetical protein ACRC2T_06485, partial [Thermoguttaceae bacterium]